MRIVIECEKKEDFIDELGFMERNMKGAIQYAMANHKLAKEGGITIFHDPNTDIMIEISNKRVVSHTGETISSKTVNMKDIYPDE